jgi:hypothetical protein
VAKIDLEQLNPFVKPFHFAEEGLTEEDDCYLTARRSFSIVCQVVKPRIAEFAKDYELHYANLTEY